MFKNQGRKTRWLFVVSLVFVLIFSTIGTASAAEFPKGETIPSSETIDDDVFIGGNNVVVDGTVNGVLVAFGQSVTLSGTINGDAFLFGETIVVGESAVIDGNLFVGAADAVINGTVTGTVFGGSMSMALSETGNVGRNFFFGGFSLTTEDGSSIGKDLFTGNYQSILSGSVNRDLKVGAGAVQLNGSVGRNASIEVGDESDPDVSMDWMQYNPSLSKYVTEVIQPGISVSDKANIEGELVYTSAVNQTSKLESITSGTVIYQTPAPEQSGSGINYSTDDVQPFNRRFPNVVTRASIMNTVRNFIKLMAVGALILWLLRKPFMKVVEAAYANPMKAMGWGFIVVAVGFLTALILPFVFVMVGVLIGFISLGSLLYLWFGLVGMTLMLVAALFFFAAFTISKVVAAYMFGKWIMKGVFKEEGEKAWLNLLLGTFLYIIIRAIPFVGWLAGLAAALIGTGAIWLAIQAAKRK